MKDFERLVLIGVVFDLSVLHKDGTRNLDIVKDALLKKVLEKDNTKIYVAHPDWHKVPREQGESTYYVISYQEPPKFSIDAAFKNAIAVVGECGEDCDKYVFLITDRFQAPNNYQYRKGFLANYIRAYKTKICVFGIGDIYDKLTLSSIADEYESDFAHLPEAALLSEKISELFNG
jgi:hypothetical protein